MRISQLHLLSAPSMKCARLRRAFRFPSFRPPLFFSSLLTALPLSLLPSASFLFKKKKKSENTATIMRNTQHELRSTQQSTCIAQEGEREECWEGRVCVPQVRRSPGKGAAGGAGDKAGKAGQA
jgi:hypothetical protein